MNIPTEVIDHCQKYSMCKGCPLGTCVAPLAEANTDRWNEWLAERIDKIRKVVQ